MKRGLFIAIEGIDACGKGTIITQLATALYDSDKNNHLLLTREPFQRDWLKKFLSQLDPLSQGKQALALFVKDRTEHCKMIETALKKGVIVLCDRYKYSTYAYQMAQGLTFEEIDSAHAGLLIPDLTIIIDIPATEATKRMHTGRKTDPHAFHNEQLLTRARENYLKLKDKLKENIVIIDGARSKDAVFSDVLNHVTKLITSRKSL